MTTKLHRNFFVLLSVFALFAFVTLGTSCKKDEPKADQETVKQDDGAKDKADAAKADDKKADEGAKADDTAKADDAAPTDGAAPAEEKKQGGKYPLFKFTMKYTPANARIGVLNGTADCKDGTCTIETTSETDPIQISGHVEGYESKTITLTEKVETFELNLNPLPPEK